MIDRPPSQILFHQISQTMDLGYIHDITDLSLPAIVDALYNDLGFVKPLLSSSNPQDIQTAYHSLHLELPSRTISGRITDHNMLLHGRDSVWERFSENHVDYYLSVQNNLDYWQFRLFTQFVYDLSGKNIIWLSFWEFINRQIDLYRRIERNNQNNSTISSQSPDYWHAFNTWFVALVQEFNQFFAHCVILNNSLFSQNGDQNGDQNRQSTPHSLRDILYVQLVHRIITSLSYCYLDLKLFAGQDLSSRDLPKSTWQLWRQNRAQRQQTFDLLTQSFAQNFVFNSRFVEISNHQKVLHQSLPDYNPPWLTYTPISTPSIEQLFVEQFTDPSLPKQAQLCSRKKIHAARRAYVRGLQTLLDHVPLSKPHLRRYFDIDATYFTWRFVKKSNFLSPDVPHDGWFKILLIKNQQVLNYNSCVLIRDCTQWDNLLAFVLDLQDPLTELDLLHRTNWHFYNPIDLNAHYRHDDYLDNTSKVKKYFDQLIAGYRQYLGKKIKNKVIHILDNDSEIAPWQKHKHAKSRRHFRKIKNQILCGNYQTSDKTQILRRYTTSKKMTQLTLKHCLGDLYDMFVTNRVVDIDKIQLNLRDQIQILSEDIVEIPCD